MVIIDPNDAADLLDLVPAALLLLDGNGQVLRCNGAARRLLDATDAIGIEGGTLVTRRKSEDRDLRDGLADLSPARPAGLVCLRTRESVPVLVIDLHRLPSGQVATRLSAIPAQTAPSTARLRRLFGLTPAEARVAAAMMTGLCIQAVAQVHGVEAETIRTQVKRIRNKTGARSQTQLIGILASIGTDFVTGEVK